MKTIILALWVSTGLLSFGSANAQLKLHVGATSAYNASFVLDEGLSKDPRYHSVRTYRLAPVGLAVGLDLTPGFGISLESVYARQGQVFDIIGQVNNVIRQVGERNISLDYVQLPLLLNFLNSSNARVRANFMIGPQFSFLTKGLEIYQQTQTATFILPVGTKLPAGSTNYDAQTRAYTLAANTQTIASTENTNPNNPIENFKQAQFGLTTALGLNVDLGRLVYLSSQIRANYSITDTRNEEFIQQIRNGNTGDIFGRRANLLVGVQLGVHVVFGGTRSSNRMRVK